MLVCRQFVKAFELLSTGDRNVLRSSKSTLLETKAKYHHTCTLNYNEQHFYTIIFCDEQEKDLTKLSKKKKQTEKLHAAGIFHTSLQKPKCVTCKIVDRRMAKDGLLFRRLAFLVSWMLTYEPTTFSTTADAKNVEYRYNSMKSDKNENKRDLFVKKAIALDRTILDIKEKAYEEPN